MWCTNISFNESSVVNVLIRHAAQHRTNFLMQNMVNIVFEFSSTFSVNLIKSSVLVALLDIRYRTSVITSKT